MSDAEIIVGDCVEVMRRLPADFFHSLVTDPPAGISFMGKDWDDDKGGAEEWITWMTQVARECLRVLKPGAHGLVWSLPRTSHWTATALERAGFEIRDCVTHLFGTGFPKSLDVSKAIDAKLLHGSCHPRDQKKANEQSRKKIGERSEPVRNNGFIREYDETHTVPISAPATDAARQWQGWGTALKPAAEFWWLVRKPLGEKTVAANVLKHGTGAINVDGARIAATDQAALAKNWDRVQSNHASGNQAGDMGLKAIDLSDRAPTGRFPANLVISHTLFCDDSGCAEGCAVAELDGQSGDRPGGTWPGRRSGIGYHGGKGTRGEERRDESIGGASRFFYCAKASRKDRGADNKHPTVKSTALMRYLVRLVTPPGGIVLDPFAGSGSTGVAAKAEGFGFLGIEREAEYAAVASGRLAP